jgi:STIP1 family protein 1
MYLCLREACESALKEKHFLEVSEMEGFVDDATTSHLKQLEALETVFEKAAEDDTPSEVPDYLCCRITLDIFHDPVITPSGLTYERAVILEHLQKVTCFARFIVCIKSFLVHSFNRSCHRWVDLIRSRGNHLIHHN